MEAMRTGSKVMVFTAHKNCNIAYEEIVIHIPSYHRENNNSSSSSKSQVEEEMSSGDNITAQKDQNNNSFYSSSENNNSIGICNYIFTKYKL